MTETFKAAAIRAVIGAVIAFGTSFFAAIAAHTTLAEAAIAAGGAAFGVLAIRFGAEGMIDNSSAIQRDADAKKAAPP